MYNSDFGNAATLLHITLECFVIKGGIWAMIRENRQLVTDEPVEFEK